MFQDLSQAKYIAIDLETYDPELKSKGCGAKRDGYIVGIAIATDTGVKEYYPIQHPNSANIPFGKVRNYLQHQLSREHQIKIGANILYDLEYLAVNDIHVKGKIVDVLVAEPLIDENQFQYNLDSIAEKYLKENKKATELVDWCEQRKLKGNFREYIWKMPASLVKPYAIGDVDLPLRVFQHQYKIIKEEELTQVFSIECRLIPLLLQMRLTGCRIDISKTQQFKDDLTYRQNKILKALNAVSIDPATSHAGRQSIADYLKKLNIAVSYTKKTNRPSVNMALLQTVDDPVIKSLLEYRQLEKLLGTFITSQILGSIQNDRIYAQFNQLRAQDGGTVTGRFSSSKPNLQNIPSRHKELAPRCRALFLPEEGELFGSVDYSQIEYRILCHFAAGHGFDDIRQAFINNPHLDIHQWCADTTGISRTQAKTINFGVIYGQGAAKTAASLGLTLEEAKEFLRRFNNKMPFARYVATEAANRAEHRGWVKTILGRRRRFNLYEPRDSKIEHTEKLPFDEAVKQWEFVKRAYTYKALNAVIQGSSADLLKLAMVTAFENGLFNTLTPLTTVHDELNVSVPNSSIGKEAFKELVHVMESCYPFKIPIIAEAGLGTNWSEAKYNVSKTS